MNLFLVDVLVVDVLVGCANVLRARSVLVSHICCICMLLLLPKKRRRRREKQKIIIKREEKEKTRKKKKEAHEFTPASVCPAVSMVWRHGRVPGTHNIHTPLEAHSHAEQEQQ